MKNREIKRKNVFLHLRREIGDVGLFALERGVADEHREVAVLHAQLLDARVEPGLRKFCILINYCIVKNDVFSFF